MSIQHEKPYKSKSQQPLVIRQMGRTCVAKIEAPENIGWWLQTDDVFDQDELFADDEYGDHTLYLF